MPGGVGSTGAVWPAQRQGRISALLPGEHLLRRESAGSGSFLTATGAAHRAGLAASRSAGRWGYVVGAALAGTRRSGRRRAGPATGRRTGPAGAIGGPGLL